MNIIYSAKTTFKALEQQVTRCQNSHSAKSLMILCCDANNYVSSDISRLLRGLSIPVFGGIFPGVIFNNHRYEKGFLIAELPWTIHVGIIKKISASETNLDEELEHILSDFLSVKTIFTFIDGFATRINSLIEALFATFGLQYNYMGGGAGSLSLIQKPCLLTNEGLLQDAVVLVGIVAPSGIGVRHGWKYISGPYKATSVVGNKILQIDYKPAFEMYKRIVEQHTNESLGIDNFFEIAKAFPFGINKLDTEEIVRDPLQVDNNGTITCVGEIEQGCYINVLSGQQKNLIDAAGEAVNEAFKDISIPPKNFVFFVDCISRVLFLDKNFTLELSNVYNQAGNLPVIGALTIGEIANNRKEYLEFYNKTSVIGCL
ncbi:MAG: FIST C-terminal domain-containing protein [Marinilabiliaceae bacterium]|nr:FIST C-terminal domain-containing protein [Marinilabiliaceae bacterium]